MKKIISLVLLAVTAVLLLVGCSKSNEKEIDKIRECYDRSYPHKIVVESTQQFGAQSLVSTTELTRGSIGSDFVAKKKSNLEQLRSIEDGSGVDVYTYVETVREELWFRVGVGVSADKGKTWDAEGENFFPDKGAFALNLDGELMEDVEYDDGNMSFTVPKDKTKAFFGEGTAITEDAKVKITTGGGFITEITISWVKPENMATGVEMTTVNIKAVYIYDQQNITFD